MSKRKTWPARVFLGRDESGRQQFYWLGRFETKRERDDALAKARTERPWKEQEPESMTCDQWADRYLERYERLNKASSLCTAEQALRSFRKAFGRRPVVRITHLDAEDWAQTVPQNDRKQAVALMNYVKRMRVIEHNPFEGLGGGRGKGRSEQNPPTMAELERLRDACDVLGDYAQQMRDLLDFAALTLMRPGELFELRHPDIDIRTNRIVVSRRLYRGRVDVPKNGSPKTIALVPPAREILLRQPTRTRDDGLVFVSKTNRRLTAPVMCSYWGRVTARAGLDFDFYLASKHYGVAKLYRLGLSARAIGAQAGWSEKAVDAMLVVYGHRDLVALSEIDALYAVEGDAEVERETPDVP